MADEFWSFGVKRHDEEEQQAYDQKVAEVTGQGYSQAPEAGGYYDGHMGDESGSQFPAAGEQAAVQSPEGQETAAIEQGPSSLWIAQPENLMEVWNRYDQDPNYEDEHYTRKQIESLHDYMSYKNGGKPVDQWGPLSADDRFVTDVIQKDNWWEPVQEQGSPNVDSPMKGQSPQPYTPSVAGFNEEKPLGAWDQLDWIGKGVVALSMNAKDIDAPDWTKPTQAGAKAFNSALAGPAAVKVIADVIGLAGGTGVAAALSNPWVLGGVAIGVGGLTFYQAMTGKEIPVFNKFLEISDLPDTLLEHSIGFGVQATDRFQQNIARAKEDPNDSYGLMAAINDSLKDVVANAGSMWRAGEYTYEMYGSVGDFAIDALKEIFTDQEGTKQGEGWFFNRGLNEKQQLAEGAYGDEGIRNIEKMFREMDDLGVDKDMQSAIMEEAVIRASGSSGNVSDYVAQMLLDLDILATPLQNESMGVLSKITGSELGVEATKVNRGSMLTQLPFVGDIIQATTKLKEPGGFMEWIDQYRNLARTSDVNQLSAVDRFFGGIDADGKIKEFARTEHTGLADMLPESKVAGVGNIANNVLNTFMYDVKDANDLRGRLNALRGEANGSGLVESAEVRTVRDGMRHAMDVTNPEIYIRQFEESEGARITLQKTADALGMEVKDMLSLYSETPAVFEQRVRQYAAEHNGFIADFDVSQGVDGLSTVVRGFTTAKDGKGVPLAWDIRQLQYQVTTSMIDAMADYYTDYYGVKPNGTINMVFDTMKSAQSLLLLGWSPSYFINNVINNTVTAAAEGVLGFMTPKQIRQWMDAFGVTPARMDVDEAAVFRGSGDSSMKGQSPVGGLEAFSNAVSAKKKEGTDSGLKGALAGLNGALRSANNKLGVFSSLSGQMETRQGNQLTAVAIQQYWRQRWKRGEGFHLMPDALVQTIEQQTPGMVNVIYAAIENGMNMDAINRVLFDTYVKPDAGTVMKEVCAKLFRGEANIYEELLEKSGVMTELRERIGNCRTDEERAAVVADVTKRLDDYIANLRREDLIQRANNVAAVVESEGLAPVAQMMSELEMNHTDFWIRIRREWTEAYNKIKAENLDSAGSKSLLAELVKKQDKEWAEYYKQELSAAAGILKGLGFEHESYVKYTGYMLENQKNWADFNTAKSRELKRYYERTAAIYAASEGKKGKKHAKADSVQLHEAWEDFVRNTSDLYDKHFAKEQELQGMMNNAFVEGYEFSTQKSGEQFRQNFQRIADIRKQMHDMQQDAHEKTAKMNAEDKAKFYEEFNPKYNALIREIGNLGEANAQIINDVSAEGPGYENHNPVKMTPEQTVEATEVMDANNAIREKAMRERAGYLDRDGIREGWIEAGRTPAEADLMMAVFDAAAESWAKMNGMYPDEFYSEAARLKGISGVRDQGSGVSGQGSVAGGQDYSVLHQTTAEYAAKYHDIIMQHYGTPEFREWFKQSKVVDEYGMPLVVHHGTKAQFDTFRKELLGSNTGAPSARMGFFFASDHETANNYASQGGTEFYTAIDLNFWECDHAVDMQGTVYDGSITRADCEQYLNEYRKAYYDVDERLHHYYNQAGVDSPEAFNEFINSISWTEDGKFDTGKYSEHEKQELGNQLAYYGMMLDGLINVKFEEASILANEGHVMDLYLSIQNPFVFDYEGQPRDNNRYSRLIAEAKAAGHDGVIFKNTYDGGDLTNIYIVFEPTQIKSIENDGTFNKLDPNILHQAAQERVKGTFEHTDVGNIIRMLEASDVSTMVHESGHLFRRTLSTPLLTEFTTWAGFESVAEFQELEAKWQRNDPALSAAERQRYEEAEEKFARGFEQYLMDGSAPTAGLKAVFKAFRDYLLDIYQNVKALVTGNDYSKQGDFVFHSKDGDEVLNINAEINGVKLRDIFDRMLTDDVQRIPGYTELVQDYRTQLGQDRHNMRMSDKALTRRAQAEVTKTILRNFTSMEEAEAALANYQLPMEINGWRVDDGTLFEAIKAAKDDATMNPWAQADWHEVKGTNTYAYSITEANTGKKYQLQYKVVELNDLVPSNEWFGDQLIINENYPADAQARNRQADQSDVYAHAANLNPGLLIDEQHAIDSGTPIVGEGNMFVESGNGRVLSMLYARDHFPEQWAGYQEFLRNMVGDYGIDPDQLDGFDSPVLIRERLGGDSVSFAEDANSNRNKAMSASENALTDANKVNMGTLANLDIVPGESTDTFTTEKNAMPSVEWLRSLPEMERNRYSTTNRNGDLVLSADGKTRFINALFATLYATPESMDIIKSFSETSDSNITALESALKQTLPEMARAEGLIQSGSRDASLSITADVMAAAGLLNDARKAGLNIHDYLAQSVIPGMERWTPTQALLAGFFGDAKNNVKKLRDFFNAYGEEVYKAGDPNQLSLFTETRTREQMIDAALAAALGTGQSGDSPMKGQSPVLKQSVMDSDGKWTSEFAKTLDENLQRTFDDGMAVRLDQAESVYLRGEQNVKYDTMVQRLLRDFSNGRNLSADQYLYAYEYMEWWVQGSEGDAPEGNPIWEKQIQQMVMKDFTGEHQNEVNELMRRYKKGAEVDPVAVPNSGEYFKRTYEFRHGVWNIAGNVYKDGKLVAYLPEELDLLKKTIDVDGQQYHVLGVDMQNPEGLVYYDPILEIVRTCNVGKPEGYEKPRNPFAFIKPSRQGSTPQTMPVADAYAELQQKYINPALAAFGDAYKQADLAAQTAKMSGLNLQTRAEVLKWLDQDVREDMRMEKYRAMKYSDMKKDAAMLNYNQRYGFDPMLTMLSPYQFWYTRSMWKWAKRMIDKPALGNAYERMKEYEDRNRQENLPSRLAGRFRIPMPYLPDWMGGSYYVDLMSQLYPFSQFGQSYGSDMNQATLNARTEEILEQQVQQGIISAAEKTQALADKSGAVWQDAFAQAELEIGNKEGLSGLASQFVSPPIFWDWWQKKQAGEDPGTLSSTRTGNAIQALTQGVPLISELGSFVGDAMRLPEKELRKLYGFDFNEFGQYGDQQIRKQISQMAADGELDWRKALTAMVEKSGTIWDMAADRQQKEAMLKVPGFAGAEGVKQMIAGNATLGQALGGIAMSLAGGGTIYPEGEKTLREMKALRDQAYIDEANGIEGAVRNWYDTYGDIYLTRTATYIDDPEELMKFTLYNQISQNYFAQPYAQQQQILNELGPEFYYALFNKETKNYKAVDTQKLAEWNAAIGGLTPNVGSIDVTGVEKVMKLSEPVVNAVEEHDRIKAEQFPGISTIQDIYNSLPKDLRKDFLVQYPKLEQYWEWNRQYKDDHPEYERWEKERSDYFNERTMYLSYAEMSQRTQQDLAYVKATGGELRDSSRYELEKLWRKHANPNFLGYDEYVKKLCSWQ